MREIGAYEVKTHLSQLLNDVAKGETITITKHGQPVAKLVPALGARRRPPQQVVAELRSFRRGVSLGSSLRSVVEEGRR